MGNLGLDDGLQALPLPPSSSPTEQAIAGLPGAAASLQVGGAVMLRCAVLAALRCAVWSLGCRLPE